MKKGALSFLATVYVGSSTRMSETLWDGSSPDKPRFELKWEVDTQGKEILFSASVQAIDKVRCEFGTCAVIFTQMRMYTYPL